MGPAPSSPNVAGDVPLIPSWVSRRRPWSPDLSGPVSTRSFRNPSFQDNGTAKVHVLGSALPSSLPDWLRGGTSRDEHKSGIVAVIDRNINVLDEEHVVFAAPSDFQALVDLWNIPRPILDAALHYGFLGSQRASYPDGNGSVWRLCPLYWNSSPATLLGNQGNPMFIFATSGPGGEPNNDGFPFRMLVLGPIDTLLSTEAIPCIRHMDIDDSALVKMLRVMTLHIDVTMRHWESFYATHWKSVQRSLSDMERSLGTLLRPEAIAALDEQLVIVDGALHAMNRQHDALKFLLDLASKDGLREPRPGLGLRQSIEALQLYYRRSQASIDRLGQSKEYIQLKKATLIETARLNGSELVVRNTTQMCRTSDDSSRTAAQVQELAQQSARDYARQTRRLANVAMAYLPSTVVAAFFATPFMTMDEGFSFPELPRVWIFFVSCAVATTATFAASHFWEKFEEERMREPYQVVDGSELAEDIVTQEDRQLFDARKLPDFYEAGRALAAFVERTLAKNLRSGHAGGDGDAGGGGNVGGDAGDGGDGGDGNTGGDEGAGGDGNTKGEGDAGGDGDTGGDGDAGGDGKAEGDGEAGEAGGKAEDGGDTGGDGYKAQVLGGR